MKVAESTKLRGRLDRTRHDPFKAATRLHLESIDQGMGCLADRNHRNSGVRIQIVEILSDPQHAAMTLDVALKSMIDTGLGESLLKQVPRYYSHLNLQSWVVGHWTAFRCKVSVIHPSIDSRSSLRRPSKKWSAPSMITSFFGSGMELTSFSSAGRGPN